MAVSHPAKFSVPILREIADVLGAEPRPTDQPLCILDPFCGVGGVHILREWLPEIVETFGFELEPEWATQSPWTAIGNALDLPCKSKMFDVVVTSPTFGNRMADHFKATDDSKRITYTHQIGRQLTEGNSGAMQWGDDYRVFHVQAWLEARRVLKPGGLLVIDIKNHIRGGEIQKVAEWHLTTLFNMGFLLQEVRKVRCPGMGFGQNREARVEFEHLLILRKP